MHLEKFILVNSIEDTPLDEHKLAPKFSLIKGLFLLLSNK